MSIYTQLNSRWNPITGRTDPAPAADPAHPLHTLWASEMARDDAHARADEREYDPIEDERLCCSLGCSECVGGYR